MTKKISKLARVRDYLFGPRRTHEQAENAQQSLDAQKDLSSYTVERQAFWLGGFGGGGPR
ncbi:hypothetical protein Q9R20_09560 [Microbacterium sp. PRF11]|jgi:hypothetical protein|uniref:hypothetical protein n=1 Tax=Microbacterium sp. PRF11 TaxID=2962593 RepID=UPI002881D7B2|nr:hypothetical protein [Microbacterium sp. PRF11]MDT0117239.1 hypothetical protein [Microbacterium sp. PRF11]